MSDSNETGFTGFRYMVDAKNSRQYAIEFENGSTKPPLRVFAGDQSEVALKPNETIFAFEHDFEIVSNGSTSFIQVTPVQITTGADARPNGALIGYPDQKIHYELKFIQQANGEILTKMILTQDSIASLADQGFSSKFPSSFVMPVDQNNPAVSLTRDGFVSMNKEALFFPPHQPHGAIFAQHGVRKEAGLSTALTKKNDSIVPAFTKAENKPRQASLTPTKSGFSRTDNEIEAILKKYATDLTEQAQKGRLRPVVGRDKDVRDSLVMMSRLEQGSLCFTGDAGVGKSAMFAAVAQYLVDDQKLPENLQNARVLKLDLQAMNAGAQFRGQFEERLKPLIDGLQERQGWLKGRKIILAIDEIHSQLTSGQASGGTDAANIMKPFLASEGISVMGTTTTEEYRKHIEKDPALSRRFEEKVLEQPNEAETLHIMKEGVWPIMKEHHGLTADLSDADFEYIITMSNRYAPNDAQPSKSKKVIDMAAAGAQFRGETEITRQDIIGAISQMSGLPEEFLAQEDYVRLLDLEKDLEEEVLGQSSALQQISDTLIGARSGLGDPNKPLGCFVMQGPPGVGKTETAKALARLLFGSEDALIKMDMSDYMEKHDVSKLTGAPPGYVGYEDGGSALTDQIRKKPYCVVLFDEIEKAHPDVLNVLLAPMNDGVMKDNKGKIASFKNVLILMTSNLGSRDALEAIKKKSGMGVDFDMITKKLSESQQAERILSKTYDEARKKHFRPEFIDRVNELGGFVTFVPLQRDSIERLTTRAISTINDRLSDRSGASLDNVSVAFSREIMDQLAEEGYIPDAGARPLKGLIRRKITNPLAAWLMHNKEEVAAFAAANGGAKLLIESLTDFAPKLVAVNPKAAAAVANDNKTEAKAKVKKTKIKGPAK